MRGEVRTAEKHSANQGLKRGLFVNPQLNEGAVMGMVW